MHAAVSSPPAVSYTLALPTAYGNVLVNRFDLNQSEALIKTGFAFDKIMVDTASHICRHAGKGSVMLDIGANFGLFSLACAAALKEREGVVHAYEGQRILSYMIAGSAALNSLENLFVHHACVGNSNDPVDIPHFNYYKPMNFGSVEFGKTQKEKLHQERLESIESVAQVRIDDMGIENCCLMKIDVEGMEDAVLDGAARTVGASRPVALIEYLKSDAHQLAKFFKGRAYKVYIYGGDFLCVPEEKPIPNLAISLPEYNENIIFQNLWK